MHVFEMHSLPIKPRIFMNMRPTLIKMTQAHAMDTSTNVYTSGTDVEILFKVW